MVFRQHGLEAQNSHNLVSGGGNRTKCSCCPDGVWFPQRGPSRCSLEDREDCFGRATVALTRAIRHTYIVSPIDMAGMAQTLAVYHYGYHTLKNRLVQYHEPAREPSDAEAVLEWGLDTPFTSQDKPPLAIAMVVTLNGVRSLRRYSW